MEVTTKPFFSVFPDLKVSDDVRSLFEDANIREITLKKKENTLKISFQCDHLISRVDTWRMERTIREQLFSKRFVKIRFQESYHLSEQYNLKYLMEHYMKSFLFELKGKGEVIFNVVRKGDYKIEDDVITFYFEDTFVNRNKAPEIKEFFEMIVKADREGKANVTSVTFWGLSDDVTWLTSFKGEDSYPLLFDESHKKKACYDSVLAVGNEK